MEKIDQDLRTQRLMYRIIMVVGVVAALAGAYAAWYLVNVTQREIALDDERVVAFRTSFANLSWQVVIIICFAVLAFEFISLIVMGENYRSESAYPVFSVKKSLTSVVIWLLILAVLIGGMACFGVKGRDCIYDDGSVHRFNFLGQETRSYTVEEIDSAELYIRSSKHGKHGWHAYFGIEAYIAGEKYMFNYKCFHNNENTNVDRGIVGIENVLELWDGVPIVRTGTSRVKSTANYLNLNNEQREAFMKLFEVE